MSTTAKQTPAAAPAAAARSEAAAAAEPVMVAVGSPEFNDAVGGAVEAILAKREEQRLADEAEEVKRQEEAKKLTDDAEEAKKTQRAELASVIEEATKPLLAQIEALKGTTVVRNDGGDMQRDGTSTKAQRGTGDLFKGVLGIQRHTARADAAQADRSEEDNAAAAATE